MIDTTFVSTGDAALLVLDGELDWATAGAIDRVQPVADVLVVDAARLRFVDTTGLDALVRLVLRARLHGVEVRWAASSQPLDRLCDLADAAVALGFA